MNIYKKICFLFFFVCALVSAQTKEQEWKFKYNKEGVAVYYRKPASASLYELKLSTTVTSSLSSVVALLEDVSEFTRWVYKTQEAFVIKTISTSEKYYYSFTDFPWPLNDRDYVIHSVLTQDKKTKVVTAVSTAVAGMVKTKDNVIRIKTMTIKWVITPMPDKKTIAIDYILSSDPGGMLPDAIINLALDKGPRESIKQFKVLLQEDKYKNAKVEHIVE